MEEPRGQTVLKRIQLTCEQWDQLALILLERIQEHGADVAHGELVGWEQILEAVEDAQDVSGSVPYWY